jgi:plastocyanin
MKRILIILGVIVAAGGVLGGIIWLAADSAKSDDTIVARAGIHWHPELSISIKGKQIEIPEGIGLGAVEHSIHTHDTSGKLHLEFAGVVRKDDIRLKEFFKIWGKKFDSTCIFDSCNGKDGTVKFFVNGKENSEFENYVMHDGDKIEIRYETMPQGESSEAPQQGVHEITVIGTDFAFSPSTISVKPGETVRLTFKNEGSAPHNWKIQGMDIGTKTIGGGKVDTIEFTAPTDAGAYPLTAYCSVPGHADSGMVGSIVVQP